VTAPPPEEPEGSRDPRDLDFDAEFERIVADFGPPSVDEDPSVEPQDPSVDQDPSVEPVETPVEPAETQTDNLRNLFRQAWTDDSAPADPAETEEHYVPPPAPPIPRPEPRRLLAWAGLVGAPMVALILLTLGSLPAWTSFILFCWFVGGFGYLVATMTDRGRDGWDDGAQV
jgi:hypothetical protein